MPQKSKLGRAVLPGLIAAGLLAAADAGPAAAQATALAPDDAATIEELRRRL